MTSRKFLGGAVLILLASGLLPAPGHTMQADDAKPRILCIGAHPDDAEFGAAGTAAIFRATRSGKRPAGKPSGKVSRSVSG